MDVATLAPLLALLLVTGGIAGVIAGLLGVGGGIVLVPAFLFVFTQLGFDGPDVMRICLATSLATIVVTSIRSVSSHYAKGAVDTGILKGWAPGIVLGAILGVWLATLLDTQALKLIFGVLVLIVGLWLTFGSSRWTIASEMPTEPLRSAMSFTVGTLSTLMGIGGGSFGVPIMTLFGRPIHTAVATAAGFGLLIAVPSVLGFLLAPATNAPPLTIGSVNLIAFVVVVAMTWLTTPLGVKLAHATDAGRLKRIFGGFLLLVALRMIWSVLS